MRSRHEVEYLVSQILSKHHITDPPVPIEAIAVAENLPIVESPFGTDVSGALIRSRGFSGIAVNGSQHPNRKRFTVAHELAHYIMEHKGEHDHLDWKFTVLRRDGKSSEGTETQEMEANFFAASLLMPRIFLRRDLELRAGSNGEADLQSEDIQALAKRYLVSETAMTYRLINLGLISPI
jgi:Zn-dependent peptidase ImmA (M78 family)